MSYQLVLESDSPITVRSGAIEPPNPAPNPPSPPNPSTPPGPSTPPQPGMSFSITDATRGWASTTGNAIPLSNGVPVVFRISVPAAYSTVGRAAPPTLQFAEQTGSPLGVHQIVVGQGNPAGAFEGNERRGSIVLQTADDARPNAFTLQPGDNYIALYCVADSATTMAASFNGGRA